MTCIAASRRRSRLTEGSCIYPVKRSLCKVPIRGNGAEQIFFCGAAQALMSEATATSSKHPKDPASQPQIQSKADLFPDEKQLRLLSGEVVEFGKGAISSQPTVSAWKRAEIKGYRPRKRNRKTPTGPKKYVSYHHTYTCHPGHEMSHSTDHHRLSTMPHQQPMPSHRLFGEMHEELQSLSRLVSETREVPVPQQRHSFLVGQTYGLLSYIRTLEPVSTRTSFGGQTLILRRSWLYGRHWTRADPVWHH